MRDDEACHYTVLMSPKEHHDRLIVEFMAPIVRDIRGNPDLDSFFFVRYNEPTWQLRFRILGRSQWVRGAVRERVDDALRTVDAGLVEGVEFGEYAREWERYGGPEGMRLAEQIFLHDSAAAIELIEADGRGVLETSRREFSLVHTERFLDLLRFDRERRLALYRLGHQWALDDELWTAEDIQRLDRQFDELRDGIHELLRRGDADAQLGAEASRIGRTSLDASRPVVERLLEAHARGEIAQDLVHLAWSYCHLHCNRLGIETPGEAILRYFMFKFYSEERS